MAFCKKMKEFTDVKRFQDLIESQPDFDAHEEVVFARDEQTGLQALIAVHNLSRGPGTGGTRLWRYDQFENALTDVLRLSAGMTYKNAMAELPFGGGKAVILAPKEFKSTRAEFMQAFGRAVESLQGRYCTAEDVGTNCDDMAEIAKSTRHIFGLRETSGDPSPYTARGVLLGLQESVREALGTDSLKDVRVLVQGVGHVGYHLCRLLYEKGANIIVSDVNETALARCEHEFGVDVVAPDRIFKTAIDVYAPCALGATVNERSIAQMKCGVIAGAANNQLESNETAELLRQADILYAPDYVINAGGIINIACEVSQSYNAKIATQKVDEIQGRVREIFARAKAENKTTLAVAGEMARERFQTGQSSSFRVEDLTRTAARMA
ncbi:Leu/Phe/Val dehydrogenase [Roseibacillus persicicus]|nr:Glu/Leu/Phe/Val dehydrogenase dimerization domain-containing protein [Roseibacillus persicicus]